MNKLFYLLLFISISTSFSAQPNFERRIKEIREDIKIITEMEKEALLIEIENINEQLDKKSITSVEAELQKKAKAEACADRIQSRIAPLEREIQRLVRNEVEGNTDDESMETDAESGAEEIEDYELEMEEMEDFEEDLEDIEEDINIEMRELKGDLSRMSKKWRHKKWKNRSEARTTSQFVFGFGLNNILTNGDLNSLDNNGIKLSNSRFYEWGITWKTRLAEKSALLQLKYGVSLTYNNLRPENNQYYSKSENQTSLVDHPNILSDEPYFRTTNLVLPIHLEFDFSKRRVKDEKVIVKSQKSVRVGIGGYAGLNVRTNQLLEYRLDGLRTEQITKGDYNTSDIVYGLSGYIGYKDFSIYTKYDLNPLFSNNTIDQNNVSFGIRFDFN